MKERSLQERLKEVYKKERPQRDAFGRRTATREDFGRRQATPRQIQEAIRGERSIEEDT